MQFAEVVLAILKGRVSPGHIFRPKKHCKSQQLQDYLRCMFKLADTDGNGTLDKTEFARVLKSLRKVSGFKFSPQQVMKVMKAADTNQDNKIDYGEVMHLDRQRD